MHLFQTALVAAAYISLMSAAASAASGQAASSSGQAASSSSTHQHSVKHHGGSNSSSSGHPTRSTTHSSSQSTTKLPDPSPTSAGFQLYTVDSLAKPALQLIPFACKTALSAKIHCNSHVQSWTSPSSHGPLRNQTDTDAVCVDSCGASLKEYFHHVTKNCSGVGAINHHVPELLGGRLWAGYNETCLRRNGTKDYCNDVIARFTRVPNIEAMPAAEMCSECFTERRAMMQRTPFSIYDARYQSELRIINTRCNLSHPTAIPPRPVSLPAPEPSLCVSGRRYEVSAENNARIIKDMSESGKNGGGNPTICNCDAVALAHNVSTAALYMANSLLLSNCSADAAIPPGVSLCLPLPCMRTHLLRPNETTCLEVEVMHGLRPGALRQFNPWINLRCTNLVAGSNLLGRVLCLSHQGIELEAENERAGAHRGDEGETSYNTEPPTKGEPHVQTVVGGRSHDEL